MAHVSKTRHLKSRVVSLHECEAHQLPALFCKWIASIDEGPEGSFYDRLFPPVRVFWLFLWQMLCAGGSCLEALQAALGWLALEGKDPHSVSTSGYCQARGRLPVAWIEKLAASVVVHLQSQTTGRQLWYGHQVKVVDGSSVSLPDTQKTQKAFPQAAGPKPGCGFPVMRLVCSFCLETGALVDYARSALSEHERTLWHKLWANFVPGEVVLTDRGFCGFADIWML